MAQLKWFTLWAGFGAKNAIHTQIFHLRVFVEFCELVNLRAFSTRPARFFNLHTMATMVGGTLLCEGAHFIDAIRTFITKQANVVITPLFLANPKIEFGKILKCAPSNI